jgi:thiosulfate/3-mercaptopyruvate sulfurtransferase
MSVVATTLRLGVPSSRPAAWPYRGLGNAQCWAMCCALCFVLCLALTSAPMKAQQTGAPRDRLLVSATWLAAHLHDADLVVLHTGDSTSFRRGHIGGARPVTLGDISANTDHAHMDMERDLMLEMLPAAELRSRLQALGISDRSRVVVYFADADRMSAATRVLYTLAYAGLGGSSALLDGGYDGWVHDHHPVDTGPSGPAPRAGPITAQADPSLVVDAAWVRSHIGHPGIAVIDARDRSFYDGIEDGGPRRGHVAGARSFPFTDVVDDHLRVRSADQLATQFRDAGVQPGDTVVAYCHIGMQATAVLFAARTLGHPVRLYDGSFQDWSRRKDLPVDNPAAGARGSGR